MRVYNLLVKKKKLVMVVDGYDFPLLSSFTENIMIKR